MHALCKDELLSFLLQAAGTVKKKDPVQIKLEQLEKGFSLYVNGANSELRKYRRKITPHSFLKNRPKPTRTKGECHGSLAEAAPKLELSQGGHWPACDPGAAPLELGGMKFPGNRSA